MPIDIAGHFKKAHEFSLVLPAMSFPLRFFSYKVSDGSISQGNFISDGDNESTVIIRPFHVVSKDAVQILPTNKILKFSPLKDLTFLELCPDSIVIQRSAIVAPIMVAHYDHFVSGNISLLLGVDWMFAITSTDAVFMPSRFIDAFPGAKLHRGRNGSWDFLKLDPTADAGKEYIYDLYIFRRALASRIFTAISAQRGKGSRISCELSAEPFMAHSLLSTAGVYPFSYSNRGRFISQLDNNGSVMKVAAQKQLLVMGCPRVSDLCSSLGKYYHVAPVAPTGFHGGSHDNVRYASLAIADGQDTASGELYLSYDAAARTLRVNAKYAAYPSLAEIDLRVGLLEAKRLALKNRYCGKIMFDTDLGHDVLLVHAIVDSTSFKPIKGSGYIVVPIMFGVKAYGREATNDSFLQRCRSSAEYSHKYLDIYSEEDAEACLVAPKGPMGPKRKKCESGDNAYERTYYHKRSQ
jgi:hypothetical protein